MGPGAVVTETMHAAIEHVGAGSGGTRNISGTTHYHVELERRLASLPGKGLALLFTSGYVIERCDALDALGDPAGRHHLFRQLNHASMIEGIKRGRAVSASSTPNDLAHLEELIQQDDPDAPKLIAFEIRHRCVTHAANRRSLSSASRRSSSRETGDGAASVLPY